MKDKDKSRSELIAELERLRQENQRLKQNGTLSKSANRSKAGPATGPATGPETGSRTVLVVDDNDEARDVVKAMLTDLNHGVIESGSAKDAVEIFFARKDDIDLVLTDIVMPDGNGPEMVKQMRQYAPDIKVIFMSGYAEDEIVHDEVFKVQHSSAAFLKKPFTMKDLNAALGQQLGETGGTHAG